MCLRSRALLAGSTLLLTTAACMSGRTSDSRNVQSTESPIRIASTANTGGFHCDGFVSAKPGWSCFQYVGKYGVRCSGYVAPGETPNAVPAPASYSVRDIGRPGVPALSTDEQRTVLTIERRIRSRALRFTNLPEFVVFDATSGPCADFAPGYEVLNADQSHSVFYEPGENPYRLHTITW